MAPKGEGEGGTNGHRWWSIVVIMRGTIDINTESDQEKDRSMFFFLLHIMLAADQACAPRNEQRRGHEGPQDVRCSSSWSRHDF